MDDDYKMKPKIWNLRLEYPLPTAFRRKGGISILND